MITMAEVTPTKFKKKDIFAPRKAVQDAKEKLGPAYFDLTLLECSRNAVELTKLVQEWESIDKEKAKFFRDLRREQNALTKSYKRNRSVHNCERTKADETESSEGMETTDGKQIPPGFRFRSNGEMKSMTSLPRYQDNEANDVSQYQSGSSRSLSRASSSTKDFNKDRVLYDSVDYRKEIEELEGILVNISTKLSTCTVSGSSANDSKCYLRSHSHDVDNATFDNPNNKLAYQLEKSRSRKLHQYMIKTPCSRTCSGCQYKLKPKADDTQSVNKQDKDVLNRRWCYVPTGKYVHSSSALKSATSLLRKSSSRAYYSHAEDSEAHDSVGKHIQHSSVLKSRTSLLRPCSSRVVDTRTENIASNDSVTNATRRKLSVQFKHDPNIALPDRRHSAYARSSTMKLAISSHTVDRQVKSAGENPRCVALNTAKSLPGMNTQNMFAEVSKNTESPRTRSVASLKSKLSSERVSSRLLVDFDSRLSILKEYQSEEEKHWQEKVKDFLQQLDKRKR